MNTENTEDNSSSVSSLLIYRCGRQYQYVRKANIINVPDVNNYSSFKATFESTVPKGYLIPAEFISIIEKLRAHGIVVELLRKALKFRREIPYLFLSNGYMSSQKQSPGNCSKNLHKWAHQRRSGK